MSDSEDDTYVTIGTAFDVPEEDAPLKKPAKVQDQIVVDKQGRRRFHGAFTGGFSAGFFNTVGSKEGWAPSTFVSSRSKRNEENKASAYRPEDFMDEEDFAEHGIAPRKLKTTSTFDKTDSELSQRKRLLQTAINDGELHTAIPGGIPIDDILVPTKLSIGIKLLKKMGWKPGQGIGEKVESMREEFDSTLTGKKVYGCTRPRHTGIEDAMDMKTFTGLLAPKDLQPLKFNSKNNVHGLGYSGIDPLTAMFGSDNQENQQNSFRPTGREKKGIKGQAFGVGVFEDEDEDIYGVDVLSNYDLTMGNEEDKHISYGWSGPASRSSQKGCLQGFTKSSKILVPPKKIIMVQLPTGYIPKHVFPNQNPCPSTAEPASSTRNQYEKLSSKDRSMMLGETTKTLDDVSQWTLKWDKKPDASMQEQQVIEKGGMVDEKPKSSRFSTRWDKQLHQERPKHVSAEQHSTSSVIKTTASSTATHASSTATNVPMYDPNTGAFKPFAKNPSKQQRYDEFLAAKRAGRKPEVKYEESVTEWEREREFEEFARAAVLYRPLSSSISTRFTRATIVSTDIDYSGVTKPGNAEDKPDDKKAAAMGMFGKLTRTILEWHPDKILCKRMNITSPYPKSNLKGVPGRGKKSGSFFDGTSFEKSLAMIEDSRKTETEEIDDDIQEIIKKKEKLLGKSKITIGPLSHLNELKEEKTSAEKDATPIIQLDATSKPSIDIFKAIFDNSDSSSDDDRSENEDESSVPMKNSIILNESSRDDTKHEIPISIELEYTNQLTNSDGFTETLPLNSSNDIHSASKNKALYSVPNTNKDNKVGPLSFLNRAPVKENSSEKNPFQPNENIKKEESHRNPSKQMSNANTYQLSLNGKAPTLTNDFYNRNDNRNADSGCRHSDWSSEWEEERSKKKSKKRNKKDKKSKKKSQKKDYYSSDEDKYDKRRTEKHKKSKKSKKHTKEKRRKRSSISSSEDEETRMPTDKELLEKFKKVSKTIKRPSAADFM